jgi:hypothetical protein
MVALHNHLKSSDSMPSAPQELPDLPPELWTYIFSFLLLSQKKPVMRLSKHHNFTVIQQTISAINLRYKKLLTLFINTLGKKYVRTCASFRNLLLTDLIPPDASNLSLIRNHLAKAKHTMALEFLVLEENEKQRLKDVADGEEGPRLRELFKLVDFYRQTDEYMDQGKLKEAEIAVLKIDDVQFRSTKLHRLVILQSCCKQFDHATRLSELIPDPEIQAQSKLNIMRAKVSTTVNNPDRF